MTGKCFALGEYLCTVRPGVRPGVPSPRAASLQSETVGAELRGGNARGPGGRPSSARHRAAVPVT